MKIFGPFFAMLLLTLVVWAFMYARRLAFMSAHDVDPQRLTTPERGDALISGPVNYAAYNFRNLFELPVLFYALCLYLYVTGSVDATYVTAAWTFFALRVVHSVVHSTVNIVALRFLVYLAGAIVLWFMVLRAAWRFAWGS